MITIQRSLAEPSDDDDGKHNDAEQDTKFNGSSNDDVVEHKCKNSDSSCQKSMI